LTLSLKNRNLFVKNVISGLNVISGVYGIISIEANFASWSESNMWVWITISIGCIL